MSLGRRLVGDTIVYGLAYALTRALSFALLPVLTRVFAPEEFGAYDLGISFSRGMLIATGLGMETAVALLLQGRDASGQRRAVSSYLLAQTLWGALAAVPAIAAAPWLSDALFHSSVRAELIVLGAGLAAVQALALGIVAVMKWMRRPGAYLLLSAGMAGAATLLAAALALFGHGAEGVLLGLLLGTAASLPLGLFFLRGLASLEASRADMVDCVRLGLPFAATGVSDQLLFPILVRTLLVASTGLSGVALFGAANAICLAIMMINESFANAWWPYAFSEEAAPRIREDTRRIMRLYAFVLMLSVGALTLLAEPVVAVLLGRGSFDAVAALIGPMGLAYWIKGVRQNASVTLVVAGRVWLRTALNFATFAAALAAAYVLTPRWGVAGAVWGFAAGEAAGFVLQIAVLHRAYDHRLDLGSLAAMAAAYLALVAIAGAATPADTLTFLLERGALGLAFLAVLLATIPIAESRKLLSAIRRSATGLLRR